MSHGRDAARDLRYGRRGGRWAPAEPDAIPRCDCGRALLRAELDDGKCHDCWTADQPARLFDL